MFRRLFTVTDVFEIRGRGVVLMPAVPAGRFSGAIAQRVELRFADGTTRTASAYFDIPRTSAMDPANPQFVCMLETLEKADVPVGTEVWWDPEVDDGH